MRSDTPGRIRPSRLNRREFVRISAAGVGASALIAGGRRPAAAAAPPYPDWLPASTKPPKRGGVLTRASAWDPPVIDPRHTQSVGLFQFAGLTSNRLVRHPFSDEAAGPSVVFDPVAARVVARDRTPLSVVHGRDPAALRSAILGEPFRGTLVVD